MRVAVVNLTSGGLSGGYRKYLARLMPLLAADSRVTRLGVFAPEAARALLDPALDVHTWAADDARRGYQHLRRDVLAMAPDVVFIPTARYAAFGTVPVVTMVRNMEPLSVPFSGDAPLEGLKNVARAWEARRASRRSSRVIAVSSHVRDVIVSRWRLDPLRVGVTYHGVDVPAEACAVRGGAIFTAGSIRPARGLEDLLLAVPHLPADVRIVIAGRVDPGCERYGARLQRIVRDQRIERRVHWIGQLGPEQMQREFRSARAFVMTSRAEACPNTALEAMSHGCPTISIDTPPMPEFFGDAAEYYPSADAPALARVLSRLLASRDQQARLALTARTRAARFTWESTRDGTIEQLQKAAR
jgi:glycosyltransferase involved in cell wall biosynthesis